MAKRQGTPQISASFHYLIKQAKGDPNNDIGFTGDEFARVVARLRDLAPINFTLVEEVNRVKKGENLPFLYYKELSPNCHFGRFEAAYYGRKYRNTRLGVINPEDLNLMEFHYLVDLRRDGKIIIGTQYTGNYGDYEGLKMCIEHILKSNLFNIVSRTFISVRHEIGDGEPVELKVNIRRQNDRVGGANLFSTAGVFTIRKSDYGENFALDIEQTLKPAVRGNTADRKAALALIIKQGDLMEIDDQDILGCNLIMQDGKRRHTVYLLGDSVSATKFPVNADVDYSGLPDREQVRLEMKRILDEIVTPGLRQ